MPMGKMLVALGLVLIGLGVLLMLADKLPFGGKLPGDFHFEKGDFSFYFPLGTCLVISLLCSLLLWLFRR